MVSEPEPQLNLSQPACNKEVVDPFSVSQWCSLCVNVFFWREWTLNPSLIPAATACATPDPRPTGPRPAGPPHYRYLQTDAWSRPAVFCFLFFFDQSRFNKSSWLDANVTFCMWKDEATEGLVLIRPKLINGRFKLPPCYCGETPEVQGLSPDWYQLRCCSFFSNPMNRSIIQQTHSRLLNWSGSSLKAPIFYPPLFFIPSHSPTFASWNIHHGCSSSHFVLLM